MSAYDRAGLQRLMEKYDVTEELVVGFLDRIPPSLAVLFLKGRVIQSLPEQDAVRVKEAFRRGDSIPQDLCEQLSHPGNDLLGCVFAQFKVERSKE